MPEFSIATQSLPGNGALLKLSGELTDADFDCLAVEFESVLASGAIGVTMDVSELTSVTSATLGLAMDFGKTLASRKGKLIIAAPSRTTLEVLELLGVKDAFTYVATVAEGKRAVS